jgi:hypothetical protein
MTANKTTNQSIRMLPVDDLQLGGYQRTTNETQVDKIASHFDEAKLGLLIVSERGGQYHLLDGAHRASALRKLNYTHAMCIVLTGLSYADEADYFRRQNQNNRPLTKYNLFKAGLEAGDTVCVRIDQICRDNGFLVSAGGHSFRCISAIFALMTVCAVYGYDVLNTTLKLIRATWDGINNATRREFLVGVAEFVHRFGPCDFAERMRCRNIGAIWNDYLDETCHNNRQSSDPAMRRAFCRVLVAHYNKGLGSSSKKRLVMEERK